MSINYTTKFSHGYVVTSPLTQSCLNGLNGNIRVTHDYARLLCGVTNADYLRTGITNSTENALDILWTKVDNGATETINILCFYYTRRDKVKYCVIRDKMAIIDGLDNSYEAMYRKALGLGFSESEVEILTERALDNAVAKGWITEKRKITVM